MPVAAPNNMTDFITQAQNFVKKAKEAGKSNTAIANTLTFMYNLTQKNIDAQQAMMLTPYQQGQLDIAQQGEDRLNQGTWAYNSDTGQYYNSLTGQSKAAPNADTSIGASDFGLGSPASSLPTTPQKSSINLEDLDSKWVGSNQSSSVSSPAAAPAAQLSPKAKASIQENNQRFAGPLSIVPQIPASHYSDVVQPSAPQVTPEQRAANIAANQKFAANPFSNLGANQWTYK